MNRILCLVLAFLVGCPTDMALGYVINGDLERASLENLSSDPSTALRQGRVYWNTTNKKATVYNGTAWEELGSGGSGLWNAVDNGTFESPSIPSGWSTYDDGASATPVNCTGGSPTAISAISRTVTTAEVDTDTGAGKLAKSAADGQGEGWAYTFSLPTHLRNGTVNLDWDQIITDADYTTGDIRVYVYDVDNSTLITPQFITMGGGSTPDLASGNGAVRMSFLATTADDYRLCIHVATTDAAAYDAFIDNVFIGDGGLSVSNGVGPTQSGTSLWTFTNFPTRTVTTNQYRRVGDRIEADIRFDATASDGSASAATLTLGGGLTIDTSKLTATSVGEPYGRVLWGDAGTSLKSNGITVSNSTTIVFRESDQSTWNGNEIVSGDWVNIHLSLPIAEWAGGQTLGQNQVEYACSSNGTWDAAAAAANTIYGPAGCPMSGALSASRAKVVQWQTPIDASDNIQLELTDQSDGTGWVTPAEFGTVSIRQSSTFYGVSSLKTSSTQSTATFQQYAAPSNATYAGTGSSWSSAWRWRMVKRKSGVVVPFGLATSLQPGLVTKEVSATVSSTFTLNGGGTTSSAIDIYVTRVGNKVTVDMPAVTATAGSGGTTTALTANTALPTWAWPSTNSYYCYCVFITNNNAAVGSPGLAIINTSGIISLARDGVDTAFANSQAAGFRRRHAFTYTVQ